jgi:hypothetical protein
MLSSNQKQLLARLRFEWVEQSHGQPGNVITPPPSASPEKSSADYQAHAESISKAWWKKYNELLEFKARCGHLNPTPGTRLSRWTCDQRCFAKYPNDHPRALSERKKRLLNNIGFDWARQSSGPYGNVITPSPSASPALSSADDHQAHAESIRKAWLAKYNELLDFKARYGHLNPTPGTRLS